MSATEVTRACIQGRQMPELLGFAQCYEDKDDSLAAHVGGNKKTHTN